MARAASAAAVFESRSGEKMASGLQFIAVREASLEKFFDRSFAAYLNIVLKL